MRGILAAIRHNLQRRRKSPRVADESMFGDIHLGNNGAGLQVVVLAQNMDRRRHERTGVSVICSIVRAPLSLLSCLSQPQINGADGAWMSSEMARISEMNHLMVSDSMRYAILM